MTSLIGVYAMLSLLPLLPDSRLLAAVVGGALGLMLGGVVGRGVLRALGCATSTRSEVGR